MRVCVAPATLPPEDPLDTNLHLLSTCELLGGLDPAELARVAPLARLARQPAEAVVFFQGDPPDALYIVRQGEVRIVHHAEDGRELILNRLAAGAVFGEIALLDGAPRTATAIVTTDAELLRLPRPAFVELLARRPELAQGLIRLLCQRLRASGARLEEGALLSAEGRVARYLLRVAALHGTEVPGGIRLDLHLPQHTLGAAVGLSRQTVNAALATLREAGAVDVARARVTITDRHALARIGRR